MNFGDALELMKKGEKVRVPEWKGWWFRKDGGIWIHTEDGKIFPQESIDWINAVIWREDWEVVN